MTKLPLITWVLGLVVGLAAVFLLLQPQVDNAFANQRVADAADTLQLRINLRQEALIEQANSIATSIRLSQLALNGTDIDIAVEETRMRETIPSALRVRLIRLGEAEINRDIEPPFTFTSKDLVNRIEAGERVYPEMINTKGRWVLSTAAPVKRPKETQVQGTLFIYQDITAISDSFGDEVPGNFTLTQSFDSSVSSEVLKVGSTDRGTPVSRDLDNPHWQLQFYPGEKLLAPAPVNLVIYIAPVLAALLLALAGLLVGSTSARRQLQQDSKLLARHINAVGNPGSAPKDAFALAELAPLGQQLQQLNIGSTASAAPAPSAELLSTAPAEATSESVAPSSQPVSDLSFDLNEEAPAATTLPDNIASIFRAYDIRGVIGETLTPDVIRTIGLAIGSEALMLGEQTLLVGADGRLSSPAVSAKLIEGLLATGCNVINIGTVPTPVLYFATHQTQTRSGVMITGSHNPPDYNGFKIVLGGKTLVDTDIQRLYDRVVQRDVNTGAGTLVEETVNDQYLSTIVDDVIVAQPLNVVIDCGNGVAGLLAPELLMQLGCEVTPLYCDVDGHFPNHHPDPSIAANLSDLINTVKAQQADLGLAFDGDGDRLVVVDGNGEIIAPDRLLMLLAQDVIARNPGADVVFDIKCSRHLGGLISQFGGRPIMCRSGHSFLKAKMAETSAVLGGEFSGHICFGERWFGFDDGLYAAARLLEIVGAQTESFTELMAAFPQGISTPEIKIPIDDKRKFAIIDQLLTAEVFSEAQITTIDGMRVDYADSWGLVRASNTEPCLTLRFEADDPETLHNITETFRQELVEIDESLNFSS